MKRKLLTFAIALSAFYGSRAQITLSSSSFPGPYAGTVDTFLSSGTGTTNPSLVPASGATWDMTTAVLTSPVGHTYNVIPAPAFTSATFADSILNSFSEFSYIANFQRAFTSAGYLEYGEHVKRQAVGLPTATTDSLIFVAQDAMYTTPNQLLKFPCTMGSSWSTSYTLTFNIALTVVAYSLSNTPGYLKQMITETDSVVGWGQMKVKKTDGTSGPYQHVLQIRKRIVLIDSYYVGGVPASPTLLTAFMLTQGARTGQYYATYYRPADPYPLADVYYTDSTFSTISGVTTLAQDFSTDLTASVKELAAGQTMNIYPNPVTNRWVTITVPGAAGGNWSYELTDINGAKVQSGNLSLSSSNTATQLALAETLVTGIYYISVKKDGELVAVRGLDIMK